MDFELVAFAYEVCREYWRSKGPLIMPIGGVSR